MLVKLGDLCEIKSSKRIFENEYVSSGIPFIRGQEVSDGTIFDSNSYNCYISDNRYNELKHNYGVPKKGDILIDGYLRTIFYEKVAVFVPADGLIKVKNVYDINETIKKDTISCLPNLKTSLPNSLAEAAKKE